MMKIRNILYIATALLLAGCANEELTTANNGTLSGESKTPLRIEASLSTDAVRTRAVDKTFENGDKLNVYIRHIKLNEGTNDFNDKTKYESVSITGRAPKLITFTKGTAGMEDTNDVNIKKTSDLTKYYWDDFSIGAKGDNTDLRTDNHGLQSYYAYCYNGGSPTTALNEATGVLDWTVQTDQSSSSKTSDLLWSSEQTAVRYTHSTANAGGEHGTMTIPYTHAMSEITVTITAAEGFTGDPLTNTSLKLYGMKTTATLTAPTGGITSGDATAEITMFPNDYTSGLTRSFTAIIAPGTKLKEGEKLLDITNVDDNDYTLTITSNMLTTDTWAKDHKTADPVETGSDTDSKRYVLTKSGVNYHLNVTVNKTKVQTHATLADWTTVNASGTGDIVFDNDETDNDLKMLDDSKAGITGKTDVKIVTLDDNLFKTGASFSLFTLKSESTYSSADARTNDVYNFSTISTFTNSDVSGEDKWTNNPEIYWPNKSDNYYFRALAKFNSITNNVNDITSIGTFSSDKGTAVSQGTIAQGKDILWGTTAKHKGKATTSYPEGKVYERGQAIPPRTGGVPMAFEHAMSKVTFRLASVASNEETDPMYNPQVNLNGATISISNLYTSGTITIENGTVTYKDEDLTATDAIQGTAANPITNPVISELIVIPQLIRDDAKVTITLPNEGNATYTVKLKDCVKTGSTTKIVEWKRGEHYDYTITLGKDNIDFRALIKDWDPVYGSGNANLEWD